MSTTAPFQRTHRSPQGLLGRLLSLPILLPCPSLSLSRKSLICFLSLLISSHPLEFYVSGITQYVLFLGYFEIYPHCCYQQLFQIHCTDIPQRLIHSTRRTVELSPVVGYYKQSCHEHSHSSLCMDISLHFS